MRPEFEVIIYYLTLLFNMIPCIDFSSCQMIIVIPTCFQYYESIKLFE